MDPFLDTFWTHVCFHFVTKRTSGAHLVALLAPTESSFASLAALWHLPSGHFSPAGHFLLGRGSRLLPLGSLFGDRVALICSVWTGVHSDYLWYGSTGCATTGRAICRMQGVLLRYFSLGCKWREVRFGSEIFAVAMDSRVLISEKPQGGSVQQHACF